MPDFTDPNDQGKTWLYPHIRLCLTLHCFFHFVQFLIEHSRYSWEAANVAESQKYLSAYTFMHDKIPIVYFCIQK